MVSYFVDGVNIDTTANPESIEEKKKKRLDIFTDDSKVGDALNSKFFNLPRVDVVKGLIPNLKPYIRWYFSLSDEVRSQNKELGILMTKVIYQNQCRRFLKVGTKSDFTVIMGGIRIEKINLRIGKFTNGKFAELIDQTEEEKKRTDDIALVPSNINPIQTFPYLFHFRWFILENGRIIKPLEYILLQDNYVYLLKLFLGIIGMKHAKMTIYETIFLISSILKSRYGIRRTPQMIDYLSNPDNMEAIKMKDKHHRLVKVRGDSNFIIMIKCIIGVGMLQQRVEPGRLQSKNMLTISPLLYYRMLDYMGIVVKLDDKFQHNAFNIAAESLMEIEIVDKVKEILNPLPEISEFMTVGPLAKLIFGYLNHIASAFWIMGMALPDDLKTDISRINYFFVSCHLYTSYLSRPLNLPSLKILSNFDSLISTPWNIFWIPVKYDTMGVPISMVERIRDFGISNRSRVAEYSFNNFSIDTIITEFDFYLDNPHFIYGDIEEMNSRPLYRYFLFLSNQLEVYSDYEIRDFLIERRSQLDKTTSFIDSKMAFITRKKSLADLEIILMGDYIVNRYKNRDVSSFTEDEKFKAFINKLNTLLHPENNAPRLENAADDEEGE